MICKNSRTPFKFVFCFLLLGCGGLKNSGSLGFQLMVVRPDLQRVDFFTSIPEGVDRLQIILSDGSGSTIQDTSGQSIDRTFSIDEKYLFINGIPEATDLSLTVNAIATQGTILFQARFSPITIESGKTTQIGTLNLDSLQNSAATTQPSSASTSSSSGTTPLIVSGGGTVANPYIVDTPLKLKSIGETLCGNVATNCSAVIKLTGNLDLVGQTIVPLGTSSQPFTGVFDGGGFTIKNLRIVQTSSDGTGFVGALGTGGVIKSLTIEAADIIGQNQTGMIAGISEGTIENVNISGQIAGKSEVGGALGYGKKGSITRSVTVSATVVGSGDGIGGLMGNGENAQISSSSASGSVSSAVGKAGGLIGSYSATEAVILSDISASGDVKGITQVGGLVGEATGLVSFTRCHASGKVEPNKTTGSMTGGGLLGVFGGTLVEKCFATGNINPTGLSLDSSLAGFGGLIGRMDSGQILNSYALGTVKGVALGGPAGALVGLMINGEINKCLSAGAISNSSHKGGVAGRFVAGTFVDTYWDSSTTGMANTYQGSGGEAAGTRAKTTSESQQQATYSNWDFVNVWQINEGAGYPTLR